MLRYTDLPDGKKRIAHMFAFGPSGGLELADGALTHLALCDLVARAVQQLIQRLLVLLAVVAKHVVEDVIIRVLMRRLLLVAGLTDALERLLESLAHRRRAMVVGALRPRAHRKAREQQHRPHRWAMPRHLRHDVLMRLVMPNKQLVYGRHQLLRQSCLHTRIPISVNGHR